MIEIFDSFSREDTYEYAKGLAEKSKAGDVYCLSGDLGVGKTVFLKKSKENGVGIIWYYTRIFPNQNVVRKTI